MYDANSQKWIRSLDIAEREIDKFEFNLCNSLWKLVQGEMAVLQLSNERWIFMKVPCKLINVEKYQWQICRAFNCSIYFSSFCHVYMGIFWSFLFSNNVLFFQFSLTSKYAINSFVYGGWSASHFRFYLIHSLHLSLAHHVMLLHLYRVLLIIRDAKLKSAPSNGLARSIVFAPMPSSPSSSPLFRISCECGCIQYMTDTHVTHARHA